MISSDCSASFLSAVISSADGAVEDDSVDLERTSSFFPLEAVMSKLRKKGDLEEPLAHVPRGLKENQYFLVDNNENMRRHKIGRKCDFWDDSGPWVSQITTTASYLHEGGKILKKIVNQNGEYYSEQKLNGERVSIPLSPRPDPSDVVVLHRNSAKHKDSGKYQRRVTWFEDGSEDIPHAACYEYVGTPPQSLVLRLVGKRSENSQVLKVFFMYILLCQRFFFLCFVVFFIF